jgi:hypothetical protein
MGILDFFTGGGEYADPNAIDERYGVSKGDVRQAALNTLGNVSGLLLAAGQPMSGSQRAQLLGQLGPAFGGAQTDIYNAAQRRLLGAENEQKMAQMQQLKSLANEMKDPAAFEAMYGFNPAGLPPQAVSEIIMGQRKAKALETPVDRQVRDLLSGIGDGPAAAPVGDGNVATVQSPGVDSFLRFQEQQNGSGTPPTDDAGNLYAKYMKAGQYYMSAGRPEDAKKMFDAAQFYKAAPPKPQETQIVNGTLYTFNAADGAWEETIPADEKPKERVTVGDIVYEFNRETRKWEKAIEADTTAKTKAAAFAAAQPLRAEFINLPAVKTFTESQRNLSVITDIANRANGGEAGIGTGVNDITLVYNFFKTLDPTSVVRESEFATVGQKMGLPSQITSAFQSVSGGGFLPPEIRNELVKIAEQFVTAQYGDVKRLSDEYSRMATTMGIDPSLVVLNLRSAQPQSPNTEPPTQEELTTGGASLVEKIKATTDLQALFDMGANAETWDNAAKAAYIARLNQLSAGGK